MNRLELIKQSALRVGLVPNKPTILSNRNLQATSILENNVETFNWEDQTDFEIAEQAGCSESSVRAFRASHKMPKRRKFPLKCETGYRHKDSFSERECLTILTGCDISNHESE